MNTGYEDRVATNTAVMKKYFDLTARGARDRPGCSGGA